MKISKIKEGNLVYMTIEFEKTDNILDYPKNLPIPKMNDFVMMDNWCGIVCEIKHSTVGTVTEITIKCKD